MMNVEQSRLSMGLEVGGYRVMAIGKRLKKAREGVDREKLYPLADAIKMVKERAKSKFDETVEIAINLGVDPRHADQMVRGVVTLPNGTGRTLRVGVFARGAKAEEAKAAGGDIVGAEDLVEKVQAGQIDFDRCIATPDMMPLVGRLGKVLGPRGMMPNPKIGTVTMDVATAVKGAKGGSGEFPVEKAGTVQAGSGKRFELMDAAGKPPHEVFAAEQLSGIRAMITAGGTPLGADMMDKMPKLGAIVCYGTGYDGVDLAAAAQRRISVGHSPAANAAAVADLAVTLMLAVTRRLLPADQYVRSGSWSSAKPSPLMRPQAGNHGRRVGVYGMGEIGRKIAARVAAFETDVAYFSRSRHDVPYQYLPSLEALAEWCSVLMIAG